MSAIKKNWRYGGGGEIFLAKSRILTDGTATVNDKHSFIYLFDSYLSSMRQPGLLHGVSVDDKSEFAASASHSFPPTKIGSTYLNDAIQNIPRAIRAQINNSTRGIITND